MPYAVCASVRSNLSVCEGCGPFTPKRFKMLKPGYKHTIQYRDLIAFFGPNVVAVCLAFTLSPPMHTHRKTLQR